MSGWLLDPHRLHGRRAWSPAGVTLAQAIALAPPVAVTLFERGPDQLMILIAALLASLVWELAFASLRRRAASWHGVTTALIFAVMASPDTALWQVVLAMSFGVVFGELVFGGRGYGFLPAAAAALGFLLFSFTGAGLAPAGTGLVIATLPGALLLLATGLVSWRALSMAVVVIILAGVAGQGLDGIWSSGDWIRDAWAPVLGTSFGLVFLVSDPLATASTNPGRYVHGALAGLLIVLFDTVAGPDIGQAAVVFAALLASVFAPIIDYFAVALVLRRRRAGHG